MKFLIHTCFDETKFSYERFTVKVVVYVLTWLALQRERDREREREKYHIIEKFSYKKKYFAE